MKKAIVTCLIVFLTASCAQARLFDRDMQRSLSLHSLLFPLRKYALRVSPDMSRRALRWIDFSDDMIRYTVRPGDSLGRIARRFGTTVAFIRELNLLRKDVIYPGQRLLVWPEPFTLAIDTTFNHLYLKLGDEVVKDYRVATGKMETQTPGGVFFVKSRYPYPAWFHEGKVVPGGSPYNPLGTRWLGLDEPKYGIHGTIDPELIGRGVSHGCVRMKNEDVEELYDLVPVGTMVVIKQ